MSRHSKLTHVEGIHTVVAYVYADAAARTGATGFTAEDVNKFAKQTDDGTFWVLQDTTPTWVQIALGGSVTLAVTAPADVTKAAAATGTGLTAARADHKHDVSTATAGSSTPGDTAAEGTATSLARSDHRHSLPGFGTPSSVGTANSAGSASTLVRSDHVHAHGAQTDGSLHAVATQTVAGFESAADKTKLDGISANATNTPITSTAPAAVTKATAAVGVSTEAARADHKHDVTTATASAQAPGDTASEGTATSLARSDHKHSFPAYGTSVSTVCQGNDSRLADDRTASGLRSATTVVGCSAAAAPVAGQVLTATSSTAATWQTPAAGLALTSSAPANVTKATASVGVATDAARADHKHDVTTAAASTLSVGGSNAEGTSTSLARADHTHALPAFGSTVGTFCQGNDARLSDARAPTAHASTHLPGGSDALTVATPSDIGTANAAGTANSFVRSDHVHNLPFSAVQSVLGAATSDVGFNSRKLTGVADPTNAQDVATKAYVDAVALGLTVKPAVAAIAVSNVATMSGTAQTVDGVALNSVGTRVLLTAQSTSTQDGIWVIAAGAWTRSTDMPVGSNAAGAFTFVEQGTSYADSGWVCTNNSGSAVVGTDNLAFTQFSGAGQITAGAGMTKTGNTLDVVANADGSITVNTNDIQVGVISDTQHGTRGGGTTHAVATTSVAGFESAADKTKLDGIATGATNTPLTSTGPADVTKATAAVGVSTEAARADHKHNVTTAAPSSLGTSNSEGTATSLARSDHVHAHGNQTSGTLHAVASTSAAGFLPVSNFGASTDPTVSNDNTQGYASGSIWLNVTAGTTWHAMSVATGAAVWKKLLNSGSAFANGGEAGGAARTLGNTDNYSLAFLTNNAQRLLINADGSIVTTASTAGVTAFIIKAAAAQTGDLLMFQTSAGAELSCVTKEGWFNIAGAATPFPASPLFVALDAGNTYQQLVNQNTNAGNAASTDFIVTANNGSDSTFYADFGINSSTYNQAAYNIGGANDSYVLAVGGHLTLGTATATKSVKFHTGGSTTAQLRATITDTALVMNTLPIQGVVDPTNAQDAATKAYVDANAGGNIGYKLYCRVATTASITQSGTQTIDGVACIAGDRVLCKDQATGSQNGIWVVAAGAWARSTDLNSNAEADLGVTVSIRSGTVNAGTVWILTTQPAITIGTTALAFSLRGGIAAASATAVGTTSAAGTADEWSRGDHVHSHGHALLAQQMFAADFDDPGADWATTVAAALAADTINAAVLVRRFDDTTDEGVGWSVLIPATATQVKVTFMSKAASSPSAPNRTVGVALKKREVPDNGGLGGWSSTVLTDLTITQDSYFHRATQTITLATLSLTADRFYQLELVRQNPGAGTELVGDWCLFGLIVEWLP